MALRPTTVQLPCLAAGLLSIQAFSGVSSALEQHMHDCYLISMHGAAWGAKGEISALNFTVLLLYMLAVVHSQRMRRVSSIHDRDLVGVTYSNTRAYVQASGVANVIWDSPLNP